MKLWDGRFSKQTDERMNDFHSSLSFDQRLAVDDIQGSIAHARMLGATGIIGAEEAEEIIKGLEGILTDLLAGKVTFDPKAEDIHMNIETILTERIGQVGKKLHTARSRNDQVALDLRLYLARQVELVNLELKRVQTVLVDLAEEHLETVMPGYTHLQRAQPITLAHHLLAYFEMFRRDRERLGENLSRIKVSPLGSGALAGTVFPIDREMVAGELGLNGVTRNSLDAVADRDFVLEVIFNAAMIMMHLSRFCQEIILWASSEWGFIELDDAYATGSSMMPQKKNPDAAELIRGKTGRVYGDLISLLTVMKGLPLAYNKDLQEDKEAVFEALDTTLSCLRIFTPMLASADFNRKKMLQATAEGFLNATDLADFLVARGLPFRQAHTVVGKVVARCIKAGVRLEEISEDELASLSGVEVSGFRESLEIRRCLEKRSIKSGPSPQTVAEALSEAKAYLEDY